MASITMTARDMHDKAVQYFDGRNGLPRDITQAMFWFDKSASEGYAPSMSMLGLLYSDGNLVSKDYKRAFENFEKAAHLGDKDGMFGLYMLYSHGNGVERDTEKSLECLMKAAEYGCEEAERRLGEKWFEMVLNDPELRKKVALEYQHKQAMKGDAEALNEIGAAFLAGCMDDVDCDFEMDRNKAVDMIKRSAEGGFAGGKHNLGSLHFGGIGVEKDRKLARKLHHKAHKAGFNPNRYCMFTIAPTIELAVRLHKDTIKTCSC